MKISKKNQCSMHIAQTSSSIERKLTKMNKSTLAIIAIIPTRRKSRIHSRYAKRFYLSLDDDERRRRDRRVPRVALVEPEQVSVEEYSQYSIVPVDGKYVKRKETSGRRRLINGEDCLGLVLVWSRTGGSLTFLQVIFGLSRTGIKNYLKFGKRILIKLLSRDIKSKIGTPSRCRVEAYKQAAREKRGDIRDIAGTVIKDREGGR